MNVTKRHFVEIVVNGEALEFETQDKINLRINNTIYNPEKVNVTQSEYSFSFNVPTSPKNNRIFGFANVPSVKGKFVRQFDCFVYADGVEIFKGVLRINSVADNTYKCNLVSIKNNSTDEIFGEGKMSDIRWLVPYEGTKTINEVNERQDPAYFFPLVAYGVFQKKPYFSIENDNTTLNYYSGTNVLDDTTKIYSESFIPSPKIIEIIKRMIEQKGYTYSGNVFNDELINKIYLSSSIASEQDPAYNIGGDRGKINVTFSKTNNVLFMDGVRELKYPENYCYLRDTSEEADDDLGKQEAAMVNVFDPIMGQCDVDNPEMWENGYIVIPHDGYYQITMGATIELLEEGTKWVDSFPQKDREGNINYKEYERNLDLNGFPIELQLVKNNSQELEFISTNRINYQNHPYYAQPRLNYFSDYPHERPISGFSRGERGINIPQQDQYYMDKGYTRGYDMHVNPDFVMGVSTGAEAFAVAKRDRSWDKTLPDFGYNNYKCKGYSRFVRDSLGNDTTTPLTQYQQWIDTDIPECHLQRRNGKYMTGAGNAIVWLNKNDMLSLKALFPLCKKVQTYGDTETRYNNIPKWRVNGTVTLRAFSPKKKDLKKSFYDESSFDKFLNIGNFLNKEELQKDFFTNFLNTFNLSCNVQDGNIDINTNVGLTDSNNSVELDDRVNVKEIESGMIDFPTSVDIKYTIDEEESGFYHSISDEHINDDDWKDWADRGSEKVTLIKSNYSKNEISKTSKFSYNWMMDFTLSYYYSVKDNIMTPINDGAIRVRMPIICKDENFIDGGNYEDMMKKDGRSLKQRMFFKSQPFDNVYIGVRNGYFQVASWDIGARYWVKLCVPTNLYNGKDVLRYTKDKDSLLMRYFNVNENTDSNYATIEAYITPQEYMMLKNGAMVRVDNDNYAVCSITGYDASGGNKTKIKCMKL